MTFEEASQPVAEKQETEHNDEGTVELGMVDKEQKQSASERKERIKEEFGLIIDEREAIYAQAVEANPKQEGMKAALEVHNNIVTGYADELIENSDLSPEDRVAAMIATINHDSGKLSSGLTEHHEKGVQYNRKMLEKLKGKQINGIEITDEIIDKTCDAIERHMNHPFLVNVMNGGERFPEPQTEVDKIVYDADMLANAGFKNVGFRLITEDFFNQDVEKAKENGTLPLQESFENVMAVNGVRSIKEVVMTKQGKEISEEVVGRVEQIYQDFIGQGIFEKIQNEFVDEEGGFTMKSIFEKGGVQAIIIRLNEEITKAGIKNGVDSDLLENFKM